MTREEAYYHRILLACGFDSEYDKWLESLLDEEPLSDLALELVSCGSDVKNIVGCLEGYCCDAVLDEKRVCALLCGFLKEAYNSGKMNIHSVAKTMYLFTISYNSGEHHLEPTNTMYYIEDYYDLADMGIINKDVFEKAFHEHLNNGTPVDYNALRNSNVKIRKSGILGFFKRLFN